MSNSEWERDSWTLTISVQLNKLDTDAQESVLEELQHQDVSNLEKHPDGADLQQAAHFHTYLDRRSKLTPITWNTCK